MTFTKALIHSSLEIEIIDKNYNLFSFIQNYTNEDKILFDYLNNFKENFKSIYSLYFHKVIHLAKNFNITKLENSIAENKEDSNYKNYILCLYQCYPFVFFKDLHNLISHYNEAKDFIKYDINQVVERLISLGKIVESLFIELQELLNIKIQNLQDFNFNIIDKYNEDLNKFQAIFSRINIQDNVDVIIAIILKIQGITNKYTNVYDIFFTKYYESIDENRFKMLDFDKEKILLMPIEINFSRVRIKNNFTTYIFFKKPLINGGFEEKSEIFTNSTEISILSSLAPTMFAYSKTDEILKMFKKNNFINFLIFYFENENRGLAHKREKVFKAYFDKNFNSNYTERNSSYLFRDIMSDRINLYNLKNIKEIVENTIVELNKLYNSDIKKENEQAEDTEIFSTMSNDILLQIFKNRIIQKIDFFTRLEYMPTEKNERIFLESNKDISLREKKYVNELAKIIYDSFEILK